MRSKTRRVDEQALAFVSTAKIDRTLLPERKKEEKNDGAASKTFLWNEHSGTGPCGAALAQHGGATPLLFGRTTCKNCQGKRGCLFFFPSSCIFFWSPTRLGPYCSVTRNLLTLDRLQIVTNGLQQHLMSAHKLVTHKFCILSR
jgi:hypothetical protein